MEIKIDNTKGKHCATPMLIHGEFYFKSPICNDNNHLFLYLEKWQLRNPCCSYIGTDILCSFWTRRKICKYCGLLQEEYIGFKYTIGEELHHPRENTDSSLDFYNILDRNKNGISEI